MSINKFFKPTYAKIKPKGTQMLIKKFFKPTDAKYRYRQGSWLQELKDEFKGLESDMQDQGNQTVNDVAHQMDSQDDDILVKTVQLYEEAVNNEEDELSMSSFDDSDIVTVAEMLGL